MSAHHKPVGVLVKTSLVDYPGKVAAVFFLRGCNMRCPYCYNRELVIATADKFDDENAASAAEVIAHLEKRKNVLTGFVLTGGEPLLSPEAAELVSAARGLGYLVKLDTNGSVPDILERFLSDPHIRPDYVALDIKTAPARYGLLAKKNYQKEIERSIEIVSALPPAMREFRTVLVPALVKEDDILAIARLLPRDASWFFAPFKNENCLDPSYNAIVPYTDARMTQLESAAKEIIPGARLR